MLLTSWPWSIVSIHKQLKAVLSMPQLSACNYWKQTSTLSLPTDEPFYLKYMCNSNIPKQSQNISTTHQWLAAGQVRWPHPLNLRNETIAKLINHYNGQNKRNTTTRMWKPQHNCKGHKHGKSHNIIPKTTEQKWTKTGVDIKWMQFIFTGNV